MIQEYGKQRREMGAGNCGRVPFRERVEGGKITGNDQARSVTSPMHFVMIFGQ